MKYFLSFLLIATILVACKKDKASPQTIIGKWELRDISGGQVANVPSTYKAGNGNTIEYSSSEYKMMEKSKLILKKNYVIVQESAQIDGNAYTTALIYDNEKLKWYFKLTEDKLILSIGSIALDGVTMTYQRLR